MASPQLEDGYTRIANNLFEAVIAFDFSKRQSKIVYSIIRKTYGFGKKEDVISLSQFVAMTGLNKGHVSTTMSELLSMKVITYGIIGASKTISLNKNHTQWQGLSKQKIVTETATPSGVTKTVTKGLPKREQRVTETVTTKERLKKGKENSGFELSQQTQEPVKTKEGKKTKSKGLDPSEYPEWLDREAWADFVAHRITTKKPMTAGAERIGINKLDLLRKDESQREIINRSIFGGWQGLYPSKDAKPEQSQQANQSATVFVSPRSQQGDNQ